MDQAKEYLVTWCFSVNGEEFNVDFFNDDTCEFYSWRDRNKQTEGDPIIFIKAIAGDRASKNKITNHQREFSITVTNVDPDLICEIIDLDDKIEREGDITEQEVEDIDLRLAPYFWDQVNDFLPTPHPKP
ncbi:MAG: hypothetical protein Q7Q73_11000 [Verrucomicrobiota bacterium JB024]|nr:hypothetical protein [Verrucomicrobiota bacterium JB024]